MKSTFFLLFYCFLFVLSGCSKDKPSDVLLFATSAEYPPFEYKSRGELLGFDIELATIIAKEPGKNAEFEDMKFGAVLPAVHTGMVDAAISAITITEERKRGLIFLLPIMWRAWQLFFKSLLLRSNWSFQKKQ